MSELPYPLHPGAPEGATRRVLTLLRMSRDYGRSLRLELLRTAKALYPHLRFFGQSIVNDNMEVPRPGMIDADANGNPKRVHISRMLFKPEETSFFVMYSQGRRLRMLRVGGHRSDGSGEPAATEGEPGAGTGEEAPVDP